MPKPKPPLEREVQQVVRQYMALRGWILLCDSSQGYRPEGGTRVTVGFPDLMFGHPEKRALVFLEVKRPGGKTTLHQDAWHGKARRCGAIVGVVDSAEATERVLESEGLL